MAFFTYIVASGRNGTIYVGSTDLGLYFPGLGEAIGLDLAKIHPGLIENPGLASVWLGNRTTAACTEGS